MTRVNSYILPASKSFLRSVITDVPCMRRALPSTWSLTKSSRSAHWLSTSSRVSPSRSKIWLQHLPDNNITWATMQGQLPPKRLQESRQVRFKFSADTERNEKPPLSFENIAEKCAESQNAADVAGLSSPFTTIEGDKQGWDGPSSQLVLILGQMPMPRQPP